MNEEEDTGRVLLERVQAIAVVCRVLGGAMRADFEDVNQHTDVVEDRRALRGEVQSMNAFWPPVPEVEDETSEEADVVLLDVNCRAEGQNERCGVVRARRCPVYPLNSALS